MRLFIAIFFLASQLNAATVSVATFGAAGDAVTLTASTTSGSAAIVVTSTNRFSAPDVGKLILLFGVGTATTGTNHQDFIGTISSLSAGTNLILSATLGSTASGVTGTVGTSNAGPFQSAINSLSGTNDVITVPSGSYLLL